ncbi:MAG: PAS domain-containing protein [Rhodospirillales bacterium]|nr:PAS domain-containing protein [Rhodospirillales bacterium]
MIWSLQRWWLAHRGNDIPDRSELDPEEFKYILPHVLLSEVVRDPFRIRFRLAGSAVVAVKGLNISGHYLDELISSDDEPWMEHYIRAYGSRAPDIRRELSDDN